MAIEATMEQKTLRDKHAFLLANGWFEVFKIRDQNRPVFYFGHRQVISPMIMEAAYDLAIQVFERAKNEHINEVLERAGEKMGIRTESIRSDTEEITRCLYPRTTKASTGSQDSKPRINPTDESSEQFDMGTS